LPSQSRDSTKEPVIDPELVEWLESITPPMEADPGIAHEVLIFNSGKRSLIAFLRHRAAQQYRKAEQSKTA
jgi:hypothetical protein